MSLLNGGLQEFLLPFALTVTYSLLASLACGIDRRTVNECRVVEKYQASRT